jgi:hypothetical protein
MIERCKTGTLHAIWHNLGAVSRHSLFDTVVVDGLVLSVWRPGFLQLPEGMDGESMKRHMLLSIPVGMMAGIGLTALSTVISYSLVLI